MFHQLGLFWRGFSALFGDRVGMTTPLRRFLSNFGCHDFLRPFLSSIALSRRCCTIRIGPTDSLRASGFLLTSFNGVVMSDGESSSSRRGMLPELHVFSARLELRVITSVTSIIVFARRITVTFLAPFHTLFTTFTGSLLDYGWLPTFYMV